jgi:hypothetical protein
VRLAAALVVSVALFTWSNDALAGKPPRHPDASAVDQYRESIPTASGPSYARTSGAAPAPKPLAPVVAAAIVKHAGPRAALLTKAATSPDYGAPVKVLPRPRLVVAPARAGTLSAVVALPRAVADSSGSRSIELLAALLAVVTATALAVRFLR